MKKANIFVVALLALALLSPLVFAAMAVETYTVTPTTLKPGEEGSVSFTIKNVASTTSTSSLEDVQVFFTASKGMEFKSASPYVVGTIDSGGSAVVSIPFRVLPNAKGGVLTVSFFISQKDKTDLKTVNANIQVANPPIISVSSDKQTVLSTETIELTLKNNGGVANKLTLKLKDGSDFAFIGTTEIYVGDVTGEAKVSVPLDSRNAPEGVNSIPFLLTYQQEGGNSVNETKYLTVAVKKEKADVVFTQAGTIVTGRDNVLLLKVKNTGRELKDLKFYLEDEKLVAKESKLVRLGNLKPGEEKQLSLLVFVGAQPGVRNADVTLKWVEDDVEKEEKVAVQVSVTSDADAAIFIDAKPAPIIVGGEHTLAILVSNVGSYKIYNVELTLPESGLFEIMNAQRSQYIGGLESDDFSTVQYKVRVMAKTPGTYPVTVLVKYKDQSGVWVEKNETASIIIRPASDAANASGNGSPLPMLLVVAVIGGAGYWYFRMRKKA